MKRAACVLVVSMTVSVTGCGGKRVASDFSAVARRVPPGATAYVTTTAGERVRGRAVSVSPSALKLSLRDATAREFTPADVSEIRVRDPLWNGLLVGAGVTGLMVAALNDASCTAPYASPGCIKVSRGAGIALGVAMGAGIGVAIDALHHRRVYRGAAASRTTRVTVAPVVTPTRASIQLTLRR